MLDNQQRSVAGVEEGHTTMRTPLPWKLITSKGVVTYQPDCKTGKCSLSRTSWVCSLIVKQISSDN